MRIQQVIALTFTLLSSSSIAADCVGYKGDLKSFLKEYNHVLTASFRGSTKAENKIYTYYKVTKNYKKSTTITEITISTKAEVKNTKNANPKMMIAQMTNDPIRGKLIGFKSFGPGGVVPLSSVSCLAKFDEKLAITLGEKLYKAQQTDIQKAIKSKNWKLVEELIKERKVILKDGTPDFNAFTELLSEKKAGLAKNFLFQFDSWNYIDKDSGNTFLHIALHFNINEISLMLINRSNAINKMNHTHLTPLGIAAASRNVEMTKKLIEKGASAKKAKGQSTSTLLTFLLSDTQALEDKENAPDFNATLSLLLKNGASPEEKVQGKTPIQICISRGLDNCVERLAKAGAKYKSQHPRELMFAAPDVVRKLAQVGMHSFKSLKEIKNKSKGDKNKSLIEAINDRNLKLVKELLPKMSTLNFVTEEKTKWGLNRTSPLEAASNDYKMTKLLVDNGADFSFKYDKEPLTNSLFNNYLRKCNYKSLKLLIEKKGLPSLKNYKQNHDIKGVIVKSGRGTFNRYQCHETLKTLLTSGYTIKDPEIFAYSLTLRSDSISRLLFESNHSKSNFLAVNRLIQKETQYMDTYNGYKTGSKQIIDAFNKIKKELQNESLSDQYEIMITLPPSEIPQFEVNKTYPICGRFGPALIFAKRGVRSSKDQELPFCYHASGTDSYHDIKKFKVLEKKEEWLKILYMPDKSINEYNEIITYSEGWVRNKDVITPFTANQKGKYIISLPVTGIESVAFNGTELKISPESNLCNSMYKIKMSKNLENRHNTITVGLPKGTTKDNFEIKKNYDHSTCYREGC